MPDSPEAEQVAKPLAVIRPTKKQRALLEFIQGFIDEHGYSPSYREIMNGCGYNSIATVAVHINNLISRGHLRKRDHSARSLEVTAPVAKVRVAGESKDAQHEAWLTSKINRLFDDMERGEADEIGPEALQSIVTAFELLGLASASDQLAQRLDALKFLDQAAGET